jgi:hypothetical protein
MTPAAQRARTPNQQSFNILVQPTMGVLLVLLALIIDLAGTAYRFWDFSQTFPPDADKAGILSAWVGTCPSCW